MSAEEPTPAAVARAGFEARMRGLREGGGGVLARLAGMLRRPAPEAGTQPRQRPCGAVTNAAPERREAAAGDAASGPHDRGDAGVGQADAADGH
jgi:hypothetical protein